jgi:hypothetical protein
MPRLADPPPGERVMRRIEADWQNQTVITKI